MSSCVISIDELKDNVNNFASDETLKKGLKMAEKYDISSFDTRSSSRQHRIPDSLKSGIFTSSVGHNKTVTSKLKTCLFCFGKSEVNFRESCAADLVAIIMRLAESLHSFKEQFYGCRSAQICYCW